jgi:nitrate/TMAO reductase-like tetraheme cytochrome c subunit
MPGDQPESRPWKPVIAGIVAVVLVTWCFAFEPVTRNYIAKDGLCTYCHLDRDYLYTARLSFTKQHPLDPEEGQRIAHCVDCHLPEGFWATAFAYTHFASITDLYGHFRDRQGERDGDWIPLSAARAYRVRDRLHEYDSAPCRTCHIESEIVPSTERGKNAHKDALENKETCIECHTNLVHRFVEVRGPEMAAGEEEEDLDADLDAGMEGDVDAGTDDELEDL